MRLQPNLPDGFVAVGGCMVRLGRMVEINAALCWLRSNRRAPRRSGSGAIGGARRAGRPPTNSRSRRRASTGTDCRQGLGGRSGHDGNDERKGQACRWIFHLAFGTERSSALAEQISSTMVFGSRSPAAPSEQRLSPPTRIRISALGAVRCSNLAGKEGTLIGTGRYRSTVRIIFDGIRWATSLHSTYIEPVAGKEGAAASWTGSAGNS
jgi:hypothetical protein